MRGHRRVLVMLGEPGAGSRPSIGGWEVQCECGWSGGVWPINAPARAAYRSHLDEQIDSVPRRCKRCGHVKVGTEMADRYSRHMCKSCYSAAGNQWQRDHPEAAARHKRNHHLLMKFGITLGESEALLDAQNGACAICQRQVGDRPHIDHDHATGEVRGILCFGCNVGLGQFRDDPERLRRAIAYLNRDSYGV